MVSRIVKVGAVIVVALMFLAFLLPTFADDDEDIPIEIGTLHVKVVVRFQDGTQDVLTGGFVFTDLLTLVIREKPVAAFWYMASFEPARDMEIDGSILTMEVLRGNTVMRTKQVPQPNPIDATAGPGVTYDILTGLTMDEDLVGLPDGDYTLTFSFQLVVLLAEESETRAYSVQWPEVAFHVVIPVDPPPPDDDDPPVDPPPEPPPEDPPCCGGDPPKYYSDGLLPTEPIVTKLWGPS